MTTIREKLLDLAARRCPRVQLDADDVTDREIAEHVLEATGMDLNAATPNGQPVRLRADHFVVYYALYTCDAMPAEPVASPKVSRVDRFGADEFSEQRAKLSGVTQLFVAADGARRRGDETEATRLDSIADQIAGELPTPAPSDDDPEVRQLASTRFVQREDALLVARRAVAHRRETESISRSIRSKRR